METIETTTMNMPVLALRGLTIFPGCVISFDVERDISIRALERAMEGEQYIFNKEEKYQKLTEILDRCEADWRAGRGPQRRPLRPGGGHHRRVED